MYEYIFMVCIYIFIDILFTAKCSRGCTRFSSYFEHICKEPYKNIFATLSMRALIAYTIIE